MEERDKVFTILIINKNSNEKSSREFIIKGKDLATKSTRELKEMFAKYAEETFNSMIKKENVTKFIGGI